VLGDGSGQRSLRQHEVRCTARHACTAGGAAYDFRRCARCALLQHGNLSLQRDDFVSGGGGAGFSDFGGSGGVVLLLLELQAKGGHCFTVCGINLLLLILLLLLLRLQLLHRQRNIVQALPLAAVPDARVREAGDGASLGGKEAAAPHGVHVFQVLLSGA
jgi:hypothetical protein